MAHDIDDPTRPALEKAREIIAVESELAVVHVQRAKLDQTEAELNTRLGRLRDDFAGMVRSPARAAVVTGSSASKIENYLNTNPQHARDISEIWNHFSDVELSTLRSTLIRLSNESRIVKVGRGRYAGLGYVGAIEPVDPEQREIDPV